MVARNRSRNNDGDPVAWSSVTTISEFGEDPVLYQSSGTALQDMDNTVMDDFVTPNYKRLSGQGEIINTAMKKTQTITRDNFYMYYYRIGHELRTSTNPDVWEPYVGEIEEYRPSSNKLSWVTDLPEIPSYDVSDLVEYAVNKAYADIDASDILSLCTIAEGEKTVMSLISIFSRLIRIIKRIKKLDFRYLKREISKEQLANRYMEIRYALRPLMYDAKGLVAALQTKASSKPLRLTFRGGAQYFDSDQDVTTTSRTNTNSVGVYTYDEVRTKSWSNTISVRAGVLTELDKLDALKIWGIDKPLETVWELVPFSFIIDWFINIGDTISAWAPDVGFSTLASWGTVKQTTFQHAEFAYNNVDEPVWNGTYQYRSTDHVRNMSNCYIQKTVISTERIPNPKRAILPQVKLKFNSFKLLDLIIIAKKLWR